MSYTTQLTDLQREILEKLAVTSHRLYANIDPESHEIRELDDEEQGALDQLEFENFIHSGISYGSAPNPGPLMRYYAITELGIKKLLDVSGIIAPICPKCSKMTLQQRLDFVCTTCGYSATVVFSSTS